jgi:hypothetical protein
MSHALNLTTIISLLQPPPEVFNMFDDLLLLANGKMLYHGPLQVCSHLLSTGAGQPLVLYARSNQHLQSTRCRHCRPLHAHQSPSRAAALLLSPSCAFSMRCATSRKWASTALCGRTSLASCWRSQHKQVSEATAVWRGHSETAATPQTCSAATCVIPVYLLHGEACTSRAAGQSSLMYRPVGPRRYNAW